MNNKKSIFTAISVTILIVVPLTFIATSNLLVSRYNLHKANSVMSLLDETFYKEIDKDKVDEAAAKAVAKALNDPYTEYMNVEEFENFKNQINETYYGIGVSVSKENLDDYVLISSVFENSPAYEAGLKKGDYITAVKGKTTKGRTLDDVVSEIKGKEGTTVNITILSDNIEKSIDVERRKIDKETVSSDIFNNEIGYILLTSFNENSSVKFAEHLTDLRNKGITSLIIDLRDNGGGITTEVEAIASEFLPKGSIIYSTKNRNGDERVLKSNKDGITDIPVVILINNYSASASEILASAIKENNRGVLVGEKTYGKGLVQSVYNFTDNSAVKVTIEQYFTAGGNYINKIGIEPDYNVELLSEKDEQLQYAIDYLTK